MNPKDIMTDAIHNFHPQYQQYTQYSSGKKMLMLKVLLLAWTCAERCRILIMHEYLFWKDVAKSFT